MLLLFFKGRAVMLNLPFKFLSLSLPDFLSLSSHSKAIPQEDQGSFSCHFSFASSFVIQSEGLRCTLRRTQDNNKIADNAKDSF
jgi:hypothetical protein